MPRLTLAITLLLASIALADPASPKLSPPNAAALKEPLQLITEAYKTDLLAAKTPDQKLTLSTKLLDAAKDEKDPSARFALLSKASDLATDSGNFDAASTAIDQIDAAYQIDALKLKADAARALAKTARRPDQQQSLATAAASLANVAIAADRYDIATSMAGLALASARSANDPALIQSTAATAREVKIAETAHSAIAIQLAALTAKPTDPDANLKVGEYFCFIKGDWDRGLPLLALSNNLELKALATREIASVVDPADQVKLADAWWNVAEKGATTDKLQIEQHAGLWYSRALPNLSGLAKAKVEARLAILAQHPAPGPAIAPHATLDLPASEFKTVPLPVDGVRHAIMAPSGTEIYVAAADRNVHLVSLITGKELKKLAVDADQISCLALSADGRTLAVGAFDHSVHIWNTQTATEKWKFEQGREISALAISPDGQRALTGNFGGSPWLYDLQRGAALSGVAGDSGYSAAWSPNGQFAVFGGYSGVVTVYNMKTLKKIREFKINGQLYASAISPDCTLVAGAGPGRTIYVWDLASGQEVHQLVGNQNIVHGLAFTPDGKQLLSTSDDNALRIWDPHGGREIKHFEMQEGKGEFGLTLDPHGHFAVFCTGGPSLSLLRLP
jgi:hypothetical protein